MKHFLMKDEINHSLRLSLILLNNYYNMVRYLSQFSCLNELVDLVCDKQGRLIMIIIISNLNEVYKDMALTTMRLKNVSYSDGSKPIRKNISGDFVPRSEERRVGKECISRRARHERKRRRD